MFLQLALYVSWIISPPSRLVPSAYIAIVSYQLEKISSLNCTSLSRHQPTPFFPCTLKQQLKGVRGGISSFDSICIWTHSIYLHLFHCTTFCEVTNNHPLPKSNDAFLACILCHLSGAFDSCYSFCKTFLFFWLSTKLSWVFFPISLYIGSSISPLPLFITFLKPKPQRKASSDHLFSYKVQLIHHLILPALSPKQTQNPSVSANSLNFSSLEYHINLVSGSRTMVSGQWILVEFMNLLFISG